MLRLSTTARRGGRGGGVDPRGGSRYRCLPIPPLSAFFSQTPLNTLNIFNIEGAAYWLSVTSRQTLTVQHR
jgi:hypothetical protein